MINEPKNDAPVGFEEIEHTADWAYRVWGESLEDLFIKAANGLYHLAGAQLGSEQRIEKEIHLAAVDAESLLVAWLNELLYLHESEKIGSDRIEIIQIDEKNLYARVAGAPVQQWLKDIKAVTYHNLAIISSNNHFEVTIVLDV